MKDLTAEEKHYFIDDFLSSCEDWMHGQDGEDVTKARKYLIELKDEREQYAKQKSLKAIEECKDIAKQYYHDSIIEKIETEVKPKYQ